MTAAFAADEVAGTELAGRQVRRKAVRVAEQIAGNDLAAE